MGGRIYTRQGDGGLARHPDGSRVRKDHADLELLGSLDELSSQIGAACAALPLPLPAALTDLAELLPAVQRELLRLGALLGGATADFADATATLEATIDRLQDSLPPLDRFLLPGGHPAAAALHIARAVARRAERAWVAARSSTPESAATERSAAAYLNRLSDLLFVAARSVNQATGSGEERLP